MENKIRDRVIETYDRRTKRSREHDLNARGHLPGGDTRSTLYFGPHPIYMKQGRGCYLYDWDGNEYIDFLGNYTSIIHGHAHPKITEAARIQLEKGTIFGAPSEIQYRHAKHLCDRIPSLDTVRYCNSGTEATQFALRGARAYTGKSAIIKMDGGYHGTHDVAEVNLSPDLEAVDLPSKHVEVGVPRCTMDDVVIAPFNDLEAVEKLASENQGRLAAIIVEPIMGAAGLINPLPGYLKNLREIADRYELVLIFDEIITFRLNWGGMQAMEGVRPDMTTLGKIIGGGFPVGAFGGKQEIMSVFNPEVRRSVNHGGTFNGNNVTMGAGIAALEMYDQASADRINGLGERLRKGFCRAAEKAGVKARFTGLGSLINVHWGEKEPNNAKESALMKTAAGDVVSLLHLEMLNHGIYSAPRGMFIVSTPMTEKEIDRAVEAFETTLHVLKPFIEKDFPHLLRE
jgi:glutamate-1-semialdehyde 2,1-aminomutase